MTFLEVEYRKNGALLLYKRKLYRTYGMLLCLLTSNDVITRRAGLSASAELLVSLVLSSALHIYAAPQWLMQALLMARQLVRNSVDTYLDWYLGTKLDELANEHRLVRIIQLLQGTFHM